MKEIISAKTKQISEAIEIGKSLDFKPTKKEFSNILLCGLGGSGIGGAIVSQLLKAELKIPFVCVNDYNTPAFVNENTLIIASSYSGNTEETIAAVEEGMAKKAEICVVSSGGKLTEMAKSNGWNHAIVPGGEQPRAMLAYSIIQQLFLLNRYGLIDDQHVNDLNKVNQLIESNEATTQERAKNLAKQLDGKIPVIYADSQFGGVATRFKQQLNENAKVLCWDHVLPEMTHNELVGWAGGSNIIAPIYLATKYDHPRTTARWEISRKIIGEHTDTINEICAIGDSRIEQIFYLIHHTDWVSYFLSEIRNVDSDEVEVIVYLKDEMAKR
ncbi:bifunctional phosphoglucose/phosphomannose isomerase [Paracrocinitomix mangrovi]|uniref:bifunctional phosphoglucose/phosphomannose isomerase n=1 Tax=Paracrocinitomix mangrovi TaxID=2862509 RepID=UPI001C8E1CD8|nr:bifunctional phosphoglucose/phosphomannose isomerase [Paracrocinitomix mangrovi]UKN00587.1 bifunctional phosphoglucose/phosphomannose isomerase [Paracrocinitomix mangrovi]